MSPVRSEHNSEVGCAGEVRLIPKLAKGDAILRAEPPQ